MTLCPVALAAGCKKCPVKTVIGDYPKTDADADKTDDKKSGQGGK